MRVISKPGLSALYGLWYSQSLVEFTYIFFVKMRSSMFKEYIEINIDRPSNGARTPRESMGIVIQILLNRIFTVEVSTILRLIFFLN